MPDFFDLVFRPSVTRYVSMRMHGTSAQIQPDPGSPAGLSIERVPEGTLITSNSRAHMSVHFAIPTPLTTERTEGLLAVFNEKREPVFKGASVSVVHIEIYLNAVSADFRTFTALDGNRKIFQADMDTLGPTGVLTDDPYFEELLPGAQMQKFGCDLDQRVLTVLTGLGVTFDFGFGDEPNRQVLLIGAKAVFSS
jgi:hypothetical protein